MNSDTAVFKKALDNFETVAACVKVCSDNKNLSKERAIYELDNAYANVKKCITSCFENA